MPAYGFKTRFVNPVRVGLGLTPFFQIGKTEVSDMEVDILPKRQTIRTYGKRRHARVDEALQFYWGMRTKGCFQIGIGCCSAVRGVILKWTEWRQFFTFPLKEEERGRYRRDGNLEPIANVEAFARADGFSDFDDMARFWHDEHGPTTFEGILTEWRP